MNAPEPRRTDTRTTIAIYDRPPWWRRRRSWMIVVPVVVSLASIAAFALWF